MLVFSPFNHLTWLLAQEYKSLYVFSHLVAVVYINKTIYVKNCAVMEEFVCEPASEISVWGSLIFGQTEFQQLTTPNG
jgi:hypothetical protein